VFFVAPNFTVNHSCDPNTAFDLSSPDQAEWHMRALKRIAAGEPGKQQLLISVF
jgi:SET domain